MNDLHNRLHLYSPSGFEGQIVADALQQGFQTHIDGNGTLMIVHSDSADKPAPFEDLHKKFEKYDDAQVIFTALDIQNDTLFFRMWPEIEAPFTIALRQGHSDPELLFSTHREHLERMLLSVSFALAQSLATTLLNLLYNAGDTDSPLEEEIGEFVKVTLSAHSGRPLNFSEMVK